MKYGMTSYVTRKLYETDRVSIEQIMSKEARYRATKDGWTPGETTCRWEEAGDFGEPDPDLIFLITTVEVTK